MSSSVREKIIEQIRAAKRVARGIGNAVEKGIESANDKLEHIEAKVGGVSAETGSSDSPVVSEKAKEKKPAKKKTSSTKKKVVKK